jgi:hypothetical protein
MESPRGKGNKKKDIRHTPYRMKNSNVQHPI